VGTSLRELVQRRAGSSDPVDLEKPRRAIRYVGRPASASPASGSQTIHARETKALVDEALGR
jgi:2-oxoglutarate dehydrogenase complex dehydrogenase (E1) component-like enzyme